MNSSTEEVVVGFSVEMGVEFDADIEFEVEIGEEA